MFILCHLYSVQLLQTSSALSVIRILRPVGLMAAMEENRETKKKRENMQEAILSQKPETQKEASTSWHVCDSGYYANIRINLKEKIVKGG